MKPGGRLVGPLLATLALGGCSFATIPPGRSGVLFTPAGMRAKPVPEGVAVIGPFSHVDVYSIRNQLATEDIRANTRDGAPLFARASVLSYRIVPEELTSLAREVGPDYYRIIVEPIVRSTVREVLGSYPSDQIGSDALPAIEAEITRLTSERLRPYHLVLDSVDLRTLVVELSDEAYAPVTAAAVKEQRLLAEPQDLAIAHANAAQRAERAGGVVSAWGAIAPTLSSGVLEDERNRAYQHLTTSPGTAVIVENGRLEVAP